MQTVIKTKSMNPLFDYLDELFNKEEEKLKKIEQDMKRQPGDKLPIVEEFVKKLNETTIDNWSLN